MTSIALGDLAKDTITGFEGVCIAETQWLHGCRRITLQPRELKDGKAIESASFDEPQCALVSRAVVAVGRTDNGGPRPEPNRGR